MQVDYDERVHGHDSSMLLTTFWVPTNSCRVFGQVVSRWSRFGQVLVKFCESQRSLPAWLLLLLLRGPPFPDCQFVHTLHPGDSIVCPMPLRSGGRLSKAKRGELDKIHALLPLLWPLLQSGSLRSVLETAAGSSALAPTPPGNRLRRAMWRKVGNVSDSPSVPRSMSLLLERLNKMDGVREWNTLSRVSTAPRRGFLGERERSEGVDGRNALQWVLGSACAYQFERERRRNLSAGTGREW